MIHHYITVVDHRQKNVASTLILLVIPLVFIVVTGLTITTSSASMITQALEPEKNVLWPLIRLARMLMYATIFIAALHLVSNARRHPGIVAFFLLATLSLLWSGDKVATGISIVNLLSLFSFCLVAVRYVSIGSILLCLWATSVAIIAVSFGLAVTGSPYALMADGLWRGLFPHKNTFGPLCGVTLLLTLFARPIKSVPFFFRLAVSALLAICIINSGSVGTLAMVAAGCMAGAAVLILNKVRKIQPLALVPVAGLMVLGFVCLATIVPAVVIALGRDLTFTGRTGLWQAVLPLTLQAPLGNGYGLSGGSAAVELITQQTRYIYSAIDSGYIILALDLGWPTVAIYIIGLLSLAITLPGRAESPIGLVVLNVMSCAQLTIAVTEKSGGPYLAFGTLILMMLLVSARMEAKPARRSFDGNVARPALEPVMSGQRGRRRAPL